MKTLNTAILIFDEVEVLDFAGPFEIFNVANEVEGKKLFNVYTLSEFGETINARNGLKIVPDHTILNCPKPDILIIPGGIGRKVQMFNEAILKWINFLFNDLTYLVSVCTGAFVIGKAGLLKGLKATTHHASYDEFESVFPETVLVRNVNYVDNGKIITAGGISNGIKASLHLLDKISGEELGKKTAQEMEYDY
jgi:transcriptional regulator GlxA family with amidase domain